MQDSTYPMPPPPPPPPPPANPYSAPMAPYATGPSGSLAEAERIRNTLGQHEANVRALGLLYLIGSAVAGVVTLGVLAAILTGSLTTPDTGPWFAVAVAGVLGTCLYYWIGSGLRGLRRHPRVGAIVLSVFGVLGFPVGTLIHGYFLYLLLSEPGQKVFSPEYQLVIAATPHLQFRSRWMLGCLAILVAISAIIAMTIYLSP